MIQKPGKTTIDAALTYLSRKCKTLDHLKQLHAHILTSHLPQNPSSICPLLFATATSKDLIFFSYACAIFRYLHYRNTFMCNTMIRGYVQMHFPIRAIMCYLDMLIYGLAPNNYTYPPLMKACSMAVVCGKRIGRLVHAHVVVNGFSDDPFVVSALIEYYSLHLEMENARVLFDTIPQRDVVLWTVMIDGYGKVEDVESARALFDEMPERNVISWSVIMACYSRVSDFMEVIYLYQRMQDDGIMPNESILVSFLTACAHIGALAQGMWVHSYAKRYNLVSNTILATALVDMYSKCGCVEFALSVFYGIPNKDAGAWNAIISGLALNGDAKMSLELFDEMTMSGIQPTEATFVAVLTACTHGKLVAEGIELFKRLDTLYGLQPKSEHYACVVDLLARSGKLEEAVKFVEEKMGEIGGGDANVWGALLGACRIHGNVEIANRIWKSLGIEKVADYGTQVVSYNIYKEAGWEIEANNIRKLISDSGIKKKPGSSVIDVNGMVEEFHAGNSFHSNAQQIYVMLDSLQSVVSLDE